MSRIAVWMLPVVLLCVGTPAAGEAGSPAIPSAWLAVWNNAPAADRPLQIVHAIDPSGRTPDGIEQVLHGSAPGTAARFGMQFYKDRGLGGIVCNIGFGDYMRSEKAWQDLIAGVRACQELGMVVWLYDEKGYPSGGAGGLVLGENPDFEAMALVLDRAQPEPLRVLRAYEHTHASNNYYAARRYINLIDDRAVRSFISHTHENYYRRLKPYFGRTIQAMFTDEPSLITVNLGQLPEEARRKVPVVDAVDPAAQPLPSVPWVHDLAGQYRKRFRADLSAQRSSLFEGDTPEDRKVRSQFWSLVSDLVSERYFGALQAWCRRHGVASSGHGLWEEAVMHHTPLQGNALKTLMRMHIPGLDVLSSDPRAVTEGYWMTAALPSSAALLTGRRRVMTEVSDFSQKMSGRGPCSLAEMQAAAAWQAAWGVTDFTLYYTIADRPAGEYRAYCDYVGRLNAVLKPARPDRRVLLYYPIHDLWAEYRPVAGRLQLESQSPSAQRIVRSFNRLGQMLQRRQIPFVVIDHENVARAKVKRGELNIEGHSFSSIVLPRDVQLPQAAAEVVERFRRKGGRVLADVDGLTAAALMDAIRPAYSLSPVSDRIVVGTFERDRRRILLVLNVDDRAYEGVLACGVEGKWQALEPASGAIRPAGQPDGSHIGLQLKPNEAVVLVAR